MHATLCGLACVADRHVQIRHASLWVSCRLLSFVQWVEAEHPEVHLTQDGCFNPYVGAVEAPLSELSQPQQIGGCIPQVPFLISIASVHLAFLAPQAG
jgi:hypothetical protein